MARYQKFIIVKNWKGDEVNIRLGYPMFHSDLLTKQDGKDNIDCYGGGFWDIDFNNKIIKLFGDSSDFGRPKIEDIKKAIQNMDDHQWWQFAWIVERVFEDYFEIMEIEPISDKELKTYKFDIKDYE